MMRSGFGFSATTALVLMATAGYAQPSDGPVIAGYGRIFPTPGASERPDPALRYRVVFSVTRPAGTAGNIDPSLEKVARFVNLLGANGIRTRPGDIVAIVQGAATPIVTGDRAYARKTGATANPNGRLIAALRAAGVTVAVCDQALQANGLGPDDLAAGVRLDVSALTTIATLELKGWALIPD